MKVSTNVLIATGDNLASLFKEYSFVILGIVAALFLVPGFYKPKEKSKTISVFGFFLVLMLAVVDAFLLAETGKGFSQRVACKLFPGAKNCFLDVIEDDSSETIDSQKNIKTSENSIDGILDKYQKTWTQTYPGNGANYELEGLFIDKDENIVLVNSASPRAQDQGGIWTNMLLFSSAGSLIAEHVLHYGELDTEEEIYATSVAFGSNGSIIIAGPNWSPYGYNFVKIGADYSLKMEKTFASDIQVQVRPNDILINKDNSFVILSKIGLQKFDDNGKLVWNSKLTNEYNKIFDLSYGGFLLFGNKYNSIELMETDLNGDYLKHKELQLPNSQHFGTIIPFDEESFLVFGETYSPVSDGQFPTDKDIFSLLIDKSGDVLKYKVFERPGNEEIHTHLAIEKGHYIIGGSKQNESGKEVALLLEVTESGEVINEREFEFDKNARILSIKRSESGNIYLGVDLWDKIGPAFYYYSHDPTVVKLEPSK